jgi:hypothetical protein
VNRPDEHAELAAALRILARDLDVPPVPDDLAARVRARLEAEPGRAARPRPLGRTGWDRRAVAAVAALVAVLLLAGIAPVRAAVGRLFEFAGISISSADPPTPVRSASPSASAGPSATGGPSGPGGLPETLPAGRPVSVQAAIREAGFPVRLPAAKPGPDWASLLGPRSWQVVQFGWQDPAAATGRLVLDQCRCGIQPRLIEKFGVRLDTQRTRVRAAEAVWVAGRHAVVYRDPAATGTEAWTGRIAQNTLIWQHDGVTYRLEGALTLDAALRIAESVPTEP